MPRKTDPQPGLGAAIRKLRGSMTQEELGHRSGMSVPWISRIESGAVNPTWGNVRRIARGLDVPLARLADLAEHLEKEKSPPARER